MKKEVIKLSILYPHAYPWRERIEKDGFEFDIENVKNILKNENIDNEDIRRKKGWEILKSIYVFALQSEKTEDIVESVFKDFELIDTEETTKEIVYSIMARKDLNNIEKIKIYKDLIAGRLSKIEYSAKSKYIYTWLVDLLTFYHITNHANSPNNGEELIELLVNDIKPLFFENDYSKEKIIANVKKEGLRNDRNLKFCRKTLSKYHDDYKMLLSNILETGKEEAKQTEEFDLNQELFGMLEEIDKNINVIESERRDEEISQTLYEKIDEGSKNKGETEEKLMVDKDDKNTETDERKNNFKPITEVKETSIDHDSLSSQENILHNITLNINKVVEELGFKMITKFQHEKIKGQERIEEKDTQLIKKLTSPYEGAALSEVYRMYKNIDEMDKDNIKAILTEFFSTLMLLGLEVNESLGKIGDDVKVNSKDLLKDFILSSPVENDGDIFGKIKYSGWIYKDKTITTPVIEPNK